MPETDDLQDGRITALRAQVKTPGRVSVFVDGQFAFGINRDLVLEFDLKKGLEVTAELQRKILERESYFKARSTALNYISYRDRTEQEIRRRLERADFAEPVMEATVEYLRDKGLLDDRAFAVNYAESRFRSGGYGPMRVRSDLRRKGVGRHMADEVVEDVFSERREVEETARDLARRRWDKLARESDEMKRRKKVFDYLVRRGFLFGMARQIVDGLDDGV